LNVKDYFINLGLAIRGLPGNPDAWMRRYFGGIESKAGVRVDEETAMKYSAVYGCVRIISETIASLPLNVYTRLDRGKKKNTNHYLYRILHTQPNEEMSSFLWREMALAQVLLWGNHYSQIIRDGYNRVLELWALFPERMKVERRQRDKKRIYRYQPESGSQIIFGENDILHIPGLSFDGLVGKTPLSWYREQIGLGLAMEEYSSRFFSEGMHAGGVFTTPKALKPETYKRLKEELKKNYAGIKKAHGTMLLEEDLKFDKMSINPNDAQLLESKKFQLEEIARIFRVPLHLLQNLDRGTFSNIEEQGISFVIHTIRPWLVRIEQSMNIKLFAGYEQDKNFTEFVVDGLLRGNIQARFESYRTGIQNAVYSPNDVLELENRNPYEGGDQHFIQLNMQPVEQIGELIGGRAIEIKGDEIRILPKETENTLEIEREKRGIRSAKARVRLAKSYRGLFENTITRLIKREKVDILKIAKKTFKERDAQIFNNEIDDYYKKHIDFVRKHTKPVFNTYAEAVSLEAAEEIGYDLKLESKRFTDDVRIDKFMEEYQESFNGRYTKENERVIREIVAKALIENKDPLEALEMEFNHWEEKKPEIVSTKETIKMASAISILVYKFAGIRKLLWRNTGRKTCVYCQSLDGKVVGMEETFIPAGMNYNPEGADGSMKITGPKFHPPLHRGCMCMISPE